MAFVPEISAELVHEARSWFVVHPRGLLVRREGAAIAFPTEDDVAAMGLRREDAHRLGTLDGTDALVVVASAADVAAPFEAVGLRALAGQLDAERFAVVGRALHAADWMTTSRFCGRCGAATARVPDERAMKCPRCALVVYPRISPAIITLVRKGDLALLASNAKFPGAFYSTLAGFAEIGESLEETLVREVYEEAGVRVGRVRYFGSQPWPFPNSLMIAFTAEWESGEIAIDRRELSDAKWFSIDDLPQIPPKISVARQLIDAWIADVDSSRREPGQR